MERGGKKSEKHVLGQVTAVTCRQELRQHKQIIAANAELHMLDSKVNQTPGAPKGFLFIVRH